MKRICFVLLIAFAAARADQSVMTSEALLKGCECLLLRTEGKAPNDDEMLCAVRAASYLDGFLDCLAVEQGLNPQIARVDLSKEIPVVQLARQIAGLIRETPALRKEGSARTAVISALVRYHSLRK